MKKLILLIGVVSLSLTHSYAQTHNDSVLKALKNDDLHGLLIKFGNEKTILALLEFDLKDEISMNEIWYSESAIDQSMLERNYLKKDSSFVSLRIKAIYWVWLIFSKNEKNCKSVAMLTNMCSNKKEFDYILSNSGNYQKVKNSFINDFSSFLQIWKISLQAKGLDYLQKNSLSPLSSNISFEIK